MPPVAPDRVLPTGSLFAGTGRRGSRSGGGTPNPPGCGAPAAASRSPQETERAVPSTPATPTVPRATVCRPGGSPSSALSHLYVYVTWVHTARCVGELTVVLDKISHITASFAER